MFVTLANDSGRYVDSLCIKFILNGILIFRHRCRKRIKDNLIELLIDFFRDLLILMLAGIDKHDQKIASFELIRVI